MEEASVYDEVRKPGLSVFYRLQTGERSTPIPRSDFSPNLGYFRQMVSDKDADSVSITNSPAAVDAIVLGTVNAPYKRSISATQLADALTSGQLTAWLVHVATFFTDVRPALIINFATAHNIPHSALEAAYTAMKQASGERNLSLEVALVALAQAA